MAEWKTCPNHLNLGFFIWPSLRCHHRAWWLACWWCGLCNRCLAVSNKHKVPITMLFLARILLVVTQVAYFPALPWCTNPVWAEKGFFLGGVWWAMSIINMCLAVSFSHAWFGFGVFLLLDGIPSKDKEPHLPKPYILQVNQSFNTNKVNLAFIQWGSLQWVPSGWNFRGNSLRPVARKVAHISGCYWLGLKEIGTLTVTRKRLD